MGFLSGGMGFLSNIMIDALKFFAYFGGYGWGIVWLTIAVNLALYPLTLSSIKSMAAMQRMQPKLQELQKKHKDAPQDLQKATMELYKSEGINPLGGCLPMLLKIPFFLALFWAFQSTAFMAITSDPNNNTAFLWITGRISGQAFHSESLVKDLTRAKIIILDESASQKSGTNKYVWDAAMEINEKPLKDLLRGKNEKNLDDIGTVKKALSPMIRNLKNHEVAAIISAWNETNSLAKPDRIPTPIGKISIIALLVGITTFLMQKTMPGATGQQAQMMTMFMPLFITFICWNFPVGVQLYWLVSNAVAALQQYYITKKTKQHKHKEAK